MAGVEQLVYIHPPHGLRSIRSTSQLLRQFVQPLLQPVLFDVLKCLAVYSCCSAIRFATFIGERPSRLLGTPCRTGHRSENWAIPSLCRATPSAPSEHLVELLGSSPIPRSFVASCVSFQLRLLPSTGVNRLRRYYEPLRHPNRPGLSLASGQLIHTAITAGTSRVAHGPHCVHAVANTPAGRMELVRSYTSIRFGLPTKPGRVGSCITIFGACLAFTHVTAYTLAESP